MCSLSELLNKPVRRKCQLRYNHPPLVFLFVSVENVAAAEMMSSNTDFHILTSCSIPPLPISAKVDISSSKSAS